MNNWVENLFGTIAQGSVTGYGSGHTFNPDFIPLDNAEKVLNISKKAEWLGLENRLTQKYAYEYCFPLSSVIDRLAEADINGVVDVLRLNGKGADDYATSDWAKRINALLSKPNPSQSWEQFRGQQMVYKRIFGFCPILVVMPAGFSYSDPSEASMLLNLPPWHFDYQKTEGMFGLPAVQYWKTNICGRQNQFNPEQILILEDSFVQDEKTDFLLPQSKLVGLDMAVSNLCAGMEADNVTLKRRGPLGFISHDAAATKDSVAGYLPMSQSEKAEVQRDLAKYGLSLQQYQYIVTRQALKFQSMGYDVNQLGTKDTIALAIEAICQRLNYSKLLLSNSDATFANQNDAHKALYQNNVIPSAQKDYKKYANYFKASENNCKITVDYSHLPIMQEDAESQGRAKQAKNTGLQIEWLNGVITLNQWRTALGYDTTPDGDVYYQQQGQQTTVQNDI